MLKHILVVIYFYSTSKVVRIFHSPDCQIVKRTNRAMNLLFHGLKFGGRACIRSLPVRQTDSHNIPHSLRSPRRNVQTRSQSANPGRTSVQTACTSAEHKAHTGRTQAGKNKKETGAEAQGNCTGIIPSIYEYHLFLSSGGRHASSPSITLVVNPARSISFRPRMVIPPGVVTRSISCSG